MKKPIYVLTTAFLLAACGNSDTASEQPEETTEQEEAAAEEETTAGEQEETEDALEEDTEEEAEPGETQEEESTPPSEQLSESDFWTMYGNPAMTDPGSIAIERTSIPDVNDEEGNIANRHEDIMVFAEEHIDEEGLIYFSAEEGPIWNITLAENSEAIFNYGDTFVNIEDSESYVLPEEDLQMAYELILSNRPIQLEQIPPEAYRSIEEMTNLESGIVQFLMLVAPAMNTVEIAIQNDLYDQEVFEEAMQTLEEVGNPLVLPPAPQTPNDTSLYEIIAGIKVRMGEVGQFENPAENQEEFIELYEQLRFDTNNVFAQVNYTLSEELF